MLAWRQRNNPLRQTQFDVLFGVPVARTDQQTFDVELAGNIFLGKWRPLIGWNGLVADQNQPTRIAQHAQFRRQGGAGLAGADDDDRIEHRAWVRSAARAGSAHPAPAPP